METIGTWWMWTGFGGIVLAMLAVDLFVVGGGRSHRVTFKEAGIWSVVWLGIALLFGATLWFALDATTGRTIANDKTLEFLAGYLIEKSLAVDNVFVWLMLFSVFNIPAELQKRVLILGVLGAIVMRTIMIFAGAWLIEQFHWLLYVFGGFLVLTGIKMWWFAEQTPDLEMNPVVRWMRNHLRLTDTLHGEQFFVRRNEGRTPLIYATPLFIVLVLVETTDLIFAVDSIPAIFAITTDPFIVLTSNIFAILGLRAMYFLLAGAAHRFSLLKYGLAVVLVFVGIKMLLIDLYPIPVAVSLAVVAAIIGLSIALSLRREANAGQRNRRIESRA